jgi:nucleotidyltransferase substrate binding protein (TIGR01987 family)
LSWKILGKIEAQSLLDAFGALQRSLAQPENEFTRNSSIQCFEFTLELVWKTLKRVLEVYGETPSNARDTFRVATRIKAVDKPEEWFEFIELRNLSSQTYKEAVARKIYVELPRFAIRVQGVVDVLRKLS